MLRALVAAVLCVSTAHAVAVAGGDDGAAETPEAQACLADIARRVQARYEAMQSLRARFEQSTQIKSLGDGASAETSRGVVTLAKPGKMRWSYEEPEPSLVVSDGKTVWTFDPALGEAQRFPATEAVLEGAAIQFLLGRGEILREFEIGGGPCAESPVTLELTPRKPASYSQLDLRVDAESGEIVETRIVDLFGNRTRVRFRDIETDVQPAPETFQFTPPPGTRILEAEGAP